MPLPSIERIPGGRAFASLSRRVRTLTVAGVLFVILFIVALVLPVPYVVLSPGPTYNTLGADPITPGQQVIVLGGKTANPTSGHLNMTTVRITNGSLSAFQALSAWLAGDEVVVPRTSIYPPGVSEKQQEKQDTQDFQVSQDSATAAALCELGYPKGFGVIDVVSGGPSDGVLQPGDQFVSVNGTPVTSRPALDAVLTKLQPGTKVPIVVNRGGKVANLQVTVGKPPAASHRSGGYLGVGPDTTCLAPFTVTIHLEQVGGPSAGLMFALGIIDKVGKDDLTKGRFIAGTGEITATGDVKPIGGIQLKMIAAKRKGATVFLAPAGNCGDVRKATPKGLKVVRVENLHGAVQDLLKIEKGEPVPSC